MKLKKINREAEIGGKTTKFYEVFARKDSSDVLAHVGSIEAPNDDLALATRAPSPREPLQGFTFEGYRNADGTVGTKNVLAIATSVQCVAGIAGHVARRIKEDLLPRYPNVDDVVALNHAYGCGVAFDVPAAAVSMRTLQNLVRNPNFGDEVMVIGLGCEKLRPEMLLPEAARGDEPLILQDEATVYVY